MADNVLEYIPSSTDPYEDPWTVTERTIGKNSYQGEFDRLTNWQAHKILTVTDTAYVKNNYSHRDLTHSVCILKIVIDFNDLGIKDMITPKKFYSIQTSDSF